MKPSATFVLVPALAVFASSCQPQPTPLSEAEKAAIADSAKAVVQATFAHSNKLDFDAALQTFSSDPDARFIENGAFYASLAAMKKSYAEMTPMLDSLQNTIDRWDIMVLAPDAVAISVPVHLSIKGKGRPTYHGAYAWSGIVQQRGGSWKIVQSHESWVNAEQVMAAVMGPPAKEERVKK